MNEHMQTSADLPAELGRLCVLPRVRLLEGVTGLEPMPNLARMLNRPNLLVKRDDCTGLAFGGNKVRQLEFYFGAARAEGADTVLITGAVQSNFVRLTAASARKLGMECHIQLEERVAKDNPYYRTSGNVLIDHLLGATIHSFPVGENEEAADNQLEALASELRASGRRPYVIHLGPGHPPLGALGYVVAAHELVSQISAGGYDVARIVVASGSGNTHAGLLYGLRALGNTIPVTGICVRRTADQQRPRLLGHCRRISELLDIDQPVTDADIELNDSLLAPGYGYASDEVLKAILTGARTEALMLDPTYAGKTFAGFIMEVSDSVGSGAAIFIHTGGTPGLFAYETELSDAFSRFGREFDGSAG